MIFYDFKVRSLQVSVWNVFDLLAYGDIEATKAIHMMRNRTIFYDQLGVRRLCAHWIPQNDRKVRSVQSSVHNFVTGDESQIYCYELESKQQSVHWIFPDEPKSVKAKRTQYA